MEKIFKVYYKSPIGFIEITGNEKGILSLNFINEIDTDVFQEEYPEYLTDCIKQLDEYFQGERKEFKLRLLTRGTDFQLAVWNQLMKIPYGQTYSYKDIAEKSGNIKAVRAVGNANNKNKIAIVIPCHRVIGSNNGLVGYAGGLWRKQWLLNHERKMNELI